MLATAGRYLDPWEAHILCARLVAEGIPASVSGDQHVIANWPLSIALSGAALHVPEAHLPQAREIIAAYHAGTLEQELVEACPEARETCPACGSSHVGGSVPFGQRVLAVVLYLLALAPFPTRTSRRHCGACRHRWHYDDPSPGTGA